MVFALTHCQVCKKKQNRDAGIQYALYLDFLLHWDSATLPGCSGAGPASYNCDLRSGDLLHLVRFFSSAAKPERGIIQTNVGHGWNSPAKLFFHALCLSSIRSWFACFVGRGGIAAGPHNSSGSNNRSLFHWSAPLLCGSLQLLPFYFPFFLFVCVPNP